jgi:hypothetical protein
MRVAYGGLGNQLLTAVSSIVLACLTRRHLFIEEHPRGGSFTSAFRLRWETTRNVTVPRSALATTVALDLRATTSSAFSGHLNLLCGQNTSAIAHPEHARALLLLGDVYFLKALLANPYLREVTQGFCATADLSRCFERLFTYFFFPRPVVLRAAEHTSYQHQPCAIGVHARSSGTLSSRGFKVGVERFANCVQQLLPAVAAVATGNPGVYLAAGTHDVRLQLTAELRGRSIRVDGLDDDRNRQQGLVLFSERNLRAWGVPWVAKAYESRQIISAAVDLIALSRCSLILGTQHSTFSYVAQAIRSLPQARIYDEDADGKHRKSPPNRTTCKLYSFTQPAYQAWARYLGVKRSLPPTCASALDQKAPPSFMVREARAARVFDTEQTLPYLGH